MTVKPELNEITPYLQFNRQQWGNFRKDTPLTLTESDLDKLQGQIEIVSLKEVTEIYLPLSRLLSFYVTARQTLQQATYQFLGKPEPKVPYIIGIAGSVAVGKSTTSRVLKALLSRWPDHPNVEVITTDGFLYSNAKLEKQGLMKRKGFPESYDMPSLLRVLNAIKSGQRNVRIPVYSHHYYDIVRGQYEIVDQPDIVILEGLNILQTGVRKTLQQLQVFVSDFFDFSLFVDAQAQVIQKWYIDRVLSFWRTTFKDPHSYFHYLTQMSETEVAAFAKHVWNEINKVNLMENILPYKNRAQLILEKAADHSIQKVYLRKI
ncbi:type I pantothenate kinase [Coxiella burnetii]|uniref:Pantothenate kinase n=2 Tax=Coxiella burnetii TaxID=777 RepID=COAA_COXBU|nr:type I pantothenate kinase [Coxiella burnetii]NP_819245.1 pantothenate kinase [Coxiella burnetii RSA 493]Q83EV9.1 RecName: Full=Pantothenate kinase; AltName: Full=Pantothenic acid kinase [Coxiella burnetii RSA 493]AAO89759.1 pantothenate kinase [Coxiella burnetii RSA 493]ARI65104.1 type I pantothenate kinase [Coxiella burnetii]ARK26599.1 type I pantothenate kinase [Coxiella burnetii]MCF2092987.1 type I pantothenate kinase [Coxiella burnetii]MCF2095080.1 type I pantothenate kinase [Coxiell